MKILIENSAGIRIESMADLQRLVPPEFDGRALNFGQGEGQFLVDGCVWGIYVDSDSGYYLQFEEGIREFGDLLVVVRKIFQRIELEFGCKSRCLIRGACDDMLPHERYLPGAPKP